jgi:glycosyltransferase involved in cell wall biosynthesis
MPVYNGERYLKEAMDSILNQTFQNFEFIVINDGSTDSTSAIIESYSDSRIICLRNEKNCGVAISLNKGLRIARGKYIVRMDSDDLSLPQRIERQVAFMDANPEIGICGSWLKTIGESNEIWSPPRTHDEIYVGMLFTLNVYHPTVIIRMETISHLQEFYNEDFENIEEQEYWIRLGHLGVKFANIDRVLVKYRLHEKSVNRIYHEIQEKKINNLRLMQLRNLGIEPTEEDMFTYHILMKPYLSDRAMLEKVSQLVIKIHNANKKTKIFPNQALDRELAKRWFLVCSNSSVTDVSVWILYLKNPVALNLPVFRILFMQIRRYVILLFTPKNV